jgi:ATP adenylyltransferase/5',5'''-P-1,P-4-tetraphosphate phosphorylase II
MWTCLAEFDGLAFYNAGTIAGASQSHKHLQQVPVPLGPGPARTPLDPLLGTARFEGDLGVLPGLPFVHALEGRSVLRPGAFPICPPDRNALSKDAPGRGPREQSGTL